MSKGRGLAILKPSRKLLLSGHTLCHHLSFSSNSNLEVEEEEALPHEWYQQAFPRLIKLSHALKHIDQADGRLVNTSNDSIMINYNIAQEMHEFKSIAKAFIVSPTMQQALLRNQQAARPCTCTPCFSKKQERDTVLLDSLTKVCNFLYVSAQQRKSIRLTLCRQITQPHIWRGALEEVLRDLRTEMAIYQHSPVISMAEQIATSCINFLAETSHFQDQDSSPLWAQLSSNRRPQAVKPLPLRRWQEVLEMFNHLTEWLEKDERLAGQARKVEAMQEGLYQIKDVVVEREVGYKEAQRQDCLFHRKLSANLGHSSKCLFTLLLYYLQGTVRHIEVEACGLHGSVTNGKGVLLYVGKVLTSDDERVLWGGVKQIDRALGMFKFVWETAKMKGILELQGHLWCVGAKERSLTYRGNMFFIHAFRL